MRLIIAASFVVATLMVTQTQAQNARDQAVRKDREQLSNDQSWVYDDLDKALEVAAKSKRPLMVVFR